MCVYLYLMFLFLVSYAIKECEKGVPDYVSLYISPFSPKDCNVYFW